MSTISSAAPTELDYAAFYEATYDEAHGDAALIPWSDGVSNPALVSWLNHVAHSVVRCGSRVAVVGCGLGEDARELIRRGYDVTAFDLSQTAVGWCRTIDPKNADCYQVADLFDLPPRWRHRFDLVVEIYTVQALPPSMRERTLAALGDMMSPHGALLVICRGCDESQAENPEGPPWALTPEELRDATTAAGLVADGNTDIFQDEADPPVLRIRGMFRHG